MNKEKEVFIVLTYTGTILSKIIKVYTGAEFSHVSIALDKELEEMYSFGRLNPYNPFIGGFVHENINFGTFKRFPKTRTAIYILKVTDEQYQTIKKLINNISKNKDDYKFNTLGLFANGLRIKYEKEKSFYCAEFVKYVIDQAAVELDLPKLIKPNDFKSVPSLELMYKGILKNYSWKN